MHFCTKPCAEYYWFTNRLRWWLQYSWLQTSKHWEFSKMRIAVVVFIPVTVIRQQLIHMFACKPDLTMPRWGNKLFPQYKRHIWVSSFKSLFWAKWKHRKCLYTWHLVSQEAFWRAIPGIPASPGILACKKMHMFGDENYLQECLVSEKWKMKMVLKSGLFNNSESWQGKQ